MPRTLLGSFQRSPDSLGVLKGRGGEGKRGDGTREEGEKEEREEREEGKKGEEDWSSSYQVHCQT